MGASEGKLKEQFLFVIMANREGRVNEFLTVRYVWHEKDYRNTHNM